MRVSQYYALGRGSNLDQFEPEVIVSSRYHFAVVISDAASSWDGNGSIIFIRSLSGDGKSVEQKLTLSSIRGASEEEEGQESF